ncbi:hypothetical protein Bca52824_017768 [Brassica carinata]|uniref:Uncharacterized protein n=1 Tax=Brassica carinata TaxID=52824 RepID=A0A8X7VNQ1_BRACI|nr:hypothetical protein Bca52824_017768 [Brassica carinata]
MVKASVEERLKVLGVGKSPEKNDKLSIVGEEQSLSFPSPQQNTQQKFVNSPALATTLELAKTLATKDAKDAKDDKDGKGEAYGRGSRGKRIVKDEDAADKKKPVQAEAVLKRKEKADAREKQAELKKQEAEASKKQAELKK